MTELRCAIEWRADDSRGSPGFLSGILLEYERRARDRDELFRAGSLTWPESGVILNRQHDRGRPIARFVPEVVGSEVRVALALPDTVAGRDAAVEVRNGTLRGLSVEFVPRRQSTSGGLRVIERADLVAAGLVDDPSYDAPVEVRRQRRRIWL